MQVKVALFGFLGVMGLELKCWQLETCGTIELVHFSDFFVQSIKTRHVERLYESFILFLGVSNLITSYYIYLSSIFISFSLRHAISHCD